ncbi:MAG: hypothetical protein CMO63_02630 [Verrucomicrobiales bacterium]|nr:hypothetical protein [Verrucomicrobiales bacterium]
MRQRNLAVRSAIAFLLAAAWPSGLAKPPAVTSIFPAGGKQGSEFELTAADSPETWPSAAWADHPGIKLEPLKEKKGTYKVRVAADTPAGPHLIRFYNADGASQPKLFFVGLVDEIPEKEPNDKLDGSQYLSDTPVVVNGRLGKNGDVDAFTLRANKGDWIVAQCHAYSLGSPVDAFLHLHDENGTKLAFAPDTQNIDPWLVYRAPKTGDYTLTFAGLIFPFNATARFHGSLHTVYRMTISTGPFARNTFPLGVRRGQKTPVHLVGWGFGREQAARAAMVNPSGPRDVTWVGEKNLSAPVPVVVGNLTGHRETEPNGAANTALSFEWPCAIHGRISFDDDEDRYLIAAKKGDKLRVRLRASEFNSSLDPVLRIEGEGGKQLARDDDSGPRADAALDWTVPADGQFVIAVSDLIRTGSESHFYRLEIDQPRPHLTATHTPDRLVVEAGKSVNATVTIGFADGFSGESAIVLKGLPEGVSVQTPATEKGGAVDIKLVADDDAKGANVPLSILVTEPGTTTAQMSKSAIGADKAGGERLINEVNHLWLTVKAKPPESKKEAK